MSIAITDDHRALAATVSDFLAARGARRPPGHCSRPRPTGCPRSGASCARCGWLGLHIPEEFGGSGFGLPELVVVVEELGRAVAPGPFVPSVITSAVLAAIAPPEVAARLLPGLADGSAVGAVALGGEVTVRRRRGGTARAGVVVGGHLADVLLVPPARTCWSSGWPRAGSRPRSRPTSTRPGGRPG